MTNEALVALGEALGIDRAALVAVERPDEIRHQFPVPLGNVRSLQLATVLAALEEYGDALSLEFRTGDLIEIAIQTTTRPEAISDFLARASTDYDLVVRLEKASLIARLELRDPAREVRLYLFTDALCALMEQGLTVFESELWREPTRALRVYVLDSKTSLVGPWLSIINLDETIEERSAEDEPARVERLREQRDRFIGWDQLWVQSLTPAHLRLRGEASGSRLLSLVQGQFVVLAILYLCDRARARLRDDGRREIRAEFRGQAHVAVIPLTDGAAVPGLKDSDLNAIAGLSEWVYSIDETTGRDWVADRLPFVQTRIAQMLEGRPEERRLTAFAESAEYLIEGVEWQWKAFIEGRISVYLENRKQLEALVGDTVITFRERAADLAKSLSENILAAVGVLVGTFIAASFADPFNEDLFRIGMVVYAAYLLVFPGVVGLSAQSIWFASARSDFDARMVSYKRLLGSEVDEAVGHRVDNATKGYWIWTAVVAVLYLLVVIAAFLAADKIPPLIKP